MVKPVVAAAVAAVLLAACGEQELLLPGERLELSGEAPATLEDAVNRAAPLSLPAAAVNADWTHRNGNPSHALTHPALDRVLQPVWSVRIGEGNGRKHRLTADPVVSNGRVFTLDSRARVTAVTTAGATLWTRDLTPAADRPDDASGGGIAAAGDTLYVTTGFGELTALDAATGDVRWVQDLQSAATGAPTVSNGVVHVVTRNALGWAIDAGTGRILWQVVGAPSESGLAGGPSPAIAGQLVVFPLSSGQMIAAVSGPGTQAWAASVAGERRERAFSRISDLSGDPVAVGNIIYAGNHSGRAAAFDAATGQPVWRANEGAMSPVWVAGGSVFLISDENRLIRLDSATGETIWAEDLPFFTRDRLTRRKSVYAHYGPVLAGGRLLVPSDDGQLREFDPVTGSLITSVALPRGAARNPVVAGGTLYIVTEDGTLHAFR
ncbi:PQQ-binding-like beta-propeller repeat protein [Silicimonas sp. MF1-12-2]|uniref:outer membrane protein assembly factor BamB family protein n=1 Tax=Silicimonas sp. MF1-12-2 TaxID=3384793 RepID=UPI0039B5383E